MRGRADDAGPNESYPEPSELVEKIQVLLEAAGMPAQIEDQIVKLIEDWELSRE